jgi:hypothetical protein
VSQWYQRYWLYKKARNSFFYNEKINAWRCVVLSCEFVFPREISVEVLFCRRVSHHLILVCLSFLFLKGKSLEDSSLGWENAMTVQDSRVHSRRNRDDYCTGLLIESRGFSLGETRRRGMTRLLWKDASFHEPSISLFPWFLW